MSRVFPEISSSWDSGWSSSWDSMEGIPDGIEPTAAAPKKTGARPATATWQPGHTALDWVGQRVPGFALAAMLATTAAGPRIG